jgi:hypothetical protein
MFSSLKAKIIFFIALILLATASGVMYFTHRDVGKAMSQAEEGSARNVLRLVELNIQGGYKKLLTDRVGSMAHRKKGLKSRAGVALSVSEQFATLARERLVSGKYAQQTWLDWLRSLSSVEERVCLSLIIKG